MYKGEHMRTEEKTRSKKSLALLVSMVLLVVGVVGGTIAYIVTNAGPVVNEFIPTKVPCEIVEDFDGNVKQDVQIKNTGNIDAYIRAKVVITWQDENGNVAAQVPVKDTDYTITYNPGNGWVQIGDYWYCKQPVGYEAPNNLTPVLIDKCELKEGSTAPEGYYLSVEVLAESIQSQPASVVGEVWNVTVDQDGTITGEGA